MSYVFVSTVLTISICTNSISLGKRGYQVNDFRIFPGKHALLVIIRSASLVLLMSTHKMFSWRNKKKLTNYETGLGKQCKPRKYV